MSRRRRAGRHPSEPVRRLCPGRGTAGGGDLTGPWTRFCTLLITLSVPFWVAGALPLPLLGGLPISAAMTVCPALVVAVLASRDSAGSRWWRRDLVVLVLPLPDPAVLGVYAALMPVVVTLSATLLGGRAAPVAPGSWLPVLALLLPLLIAAVAEEVGWTGWLLPRLAETWGRRRAASVIGATWGVWHAVPYLQAGHPASWVLGQILFSLVFRLLIVEVTGKAGAALLGAVMLHATYNLAWQALLHWGITYSPWTTALVTGTYVGLALVLPHRSGIDRPRPTAG